MLHYLIPISIAIFLAINMGASGTSPSFSATFGANLIRRDLIPGLFGFFVLLGAATAGSRVAKTLGFGILPGNLMTTSSVCIILLACALSLLFANILKTPQSTSQSAVFAICGVAIYKDEIDWDKVLFEIVPTWFILPVIAFAITYAFGKFVYKRLRDRPMMSFVLTEKSRAWKYLTILCSCYVAYAIGSNNVANAAGPLAAMVCGDLGISQGSDESAIIILISMLLVAPWFGIGSSLLGPRVLETTGKDIVSIGPFSAAFVTFLTATLLLLASLTRGIPTSLVQLNTASIFALALLKVGTGEFVSRKTVLKLCGIWIMAPAMAFALALLFCAVLEGIDVRL
ncbi:MAG: anion permease [Planctomycetes bacterium]|nr:anion permease [Planctomycetota bacterium]